LPLLGGVFLFVICTGGGVLGFGGHREVYWEVIPLV
jgi:hypothetical protein